MMVKIHMQHLLAKKLSQNEFIPRVQSIKEYLSILGNEINSVKQSKNKRNDLVGLTTTEAQKAARDLNISISIIQSFLGYGVQGFSTSIKNEGTLKEIEIHLKDASKIKIIIEAVQ